MKTHIVILSFLLLGSCMMVLPRHLTDNASYDITDASVRLVAKFKDDTLYKTSYETEYNLPGKYYKKLSTTHTIDTFLRIGVQIKLWASIVKHEEGTFYGEYPVHGLVEKIEALTIQFTNGNDSIDIVPFLKGDSSIYEIKWRTCEYKKLPYTWGASMYFKDIDSFIHTLNDEENKVGSLPQHDYIFWIDKKAIEELAFKPTLLKMKMTLVDSTGSKRREISDYTKIN